MAKETRKERKEREEREDREKIDKRIEELREVRKIAKLGGGPKRWEKQAKAGKQMNARERLEYLLDDGSFKEFGQLFGHRDNLPTEGIVTGYGTVGGRPIAIYSQDATIKGGSIGDLHGYKMYVTLERAIEMRIPVVGILDSPGARLPKPEESETAINLGMQKIGGCVFFPNTQASGVIPQISVIMGNCAGIGVYSPGLTDFIYMVDKTSFMNITGRAMVKEVLGEDLTDEELGGAEVHCKVSGVADGRWPTEAETLDNMKELLSLLPLNFEDKAPRKDLGDDPDRYDDEIAYLVPTDPFKAFDIRNVIKRISDAGYFFEIKPEYAQEMVVGFGRLDGEVVGFVANNSTMRAGALTVDSSDKQTRFMRFCDCLNIPIIMVLDTSAYMPGSGQEHAGIIRHGAKVLYALCEATVPRICVIVRKAYGGGNLGMGTIPGFGTDMIYMWPYAELGVLGGPASVQLFYGKEIAASEDPEKAKAERLKVYMEKYANPIYESSANWYLEDVIEPRETRRTLIRSLRYMKNKKKTRIVKKHGNIPM